MPRYKKLSVGVINIKIHPHAPMLYKNLLEDIFNFREKVKLRGSDWGTPGHIFYNNSDNNLIKGFFYKYTNISPTQPWLSLIDYEPIYNENGESIPQIPDYLKPNLKFIHFIFSIYKHRLFFDADAISPLIMGKLLKGLFQDRKIIDKYGDVDVIVQSSADAIEKILSIPSITKLEISITKLNPDELSGLKKEIYKRLERLRVRNHTEIDSSSKEIGLNPDEHTKALMELAIENGKIVATGYDGDEKIVESSEPHPVIKRGYYDPKREDIYRAMKRLINSFFHNGR
ncbi:MAG: DUF4747 family protein [Desulfobaccales bacterium]